MKNDYLKEETLAMKTVKTNCVGCSSHCCRLGDFTNRENHAMLLSDGENWEEIAEYLKFTLDELAEFYIKRIPDSDRYVVRIRPDGYCAFFDKVKSNCSIHAVKPRKCWEYAQFNLCEIEPERSRQC